MALTRVTSSMFDDGTINVLHYGAAGDGVTDDSAAIGDAIDAMVDGSTLFFPKGTYLIGSVFTKTITGLYNVKIVGENAIIKFSIDQNSQVFLFNFVNCDNVEVCGTAWDGDAFVASGISFDTCRNVNVHHNSFEKFWNGNAPGIGPLYDGMGVFAEKCNQVNVSNNSFYRINRGIAFDESSTVSTTVVIDSNTFYEMGFGCITTAHKNCTVSNNTMRYASLGPFKRGHNTYTRTDMRDPAWVPIVNDSTYYGTGKGPAINIGSGLLNAFDCRPENLTIVNNSIDYVAEYGIGIEGIKYIGTQEFAGPAKNCVIANNVLQNTGIEAIFVTACRGLSVTGNTILNPGLANLSLPAITVAPKSVPSAFSGESLVNKQLNGLYGVTISNNNIRDENGYVAVGLSTGPTNIEQGIDTCIVSDNTFTLSRAGAIGISFSTFGATLSNPNVFKIQIMDNSFGHLSGTGGRYLNLSGGPILNNSAIYGNRVNGFTDWFYTDQAYADFSTGPSEASSTSTQSATIPGFQRGTIAFYKSVDDAFTIPAIFHGFETSTLNGPSQGFFGYSGQGTGGNYLEGTFSMGYKTGASTWANAYSWTKDAYLPSPDADKDLGGASNRWVDIYATNGTIITSDEREKQDISDITEAEQRVAVAIKGLIKSYRFKSAVEKKGDDARIHFGVIAQEVAEAFRAEDLNPDRYGIFCYDEWEEEVDADGNVIKAAGNRYGIRYEELLAFVIST
jgi:hypothetical protein